VTGPTDDAIGGYFALERGKGNGMENLRAAASYQSARSAIAALLQATGATTAWVPHFICGAVMDALDFAGVQIRRYPLDAARGVPGDLPLAERDWLVCVDYFGLTADACDAAIARHGGHRVLVDASQALFHRPRPATSTVYSPRKFVGIPDGGLLVTPHPLPPPSIADESASAGRSQHLAARAGGDVAAGHALFQEAEASLADCAPRAMSATTARMLATIDFGEVRRRRIANFIHLAGALRRHGFTIVDLPGDAVPLCCPVTGVDASPLRRALASRRIFAPAYWPDAVVPGDDQVGLSLRDATLYLPCDQRYGDADMQRVARSLLEIREAL
jgi:hypothetical protein